MKTVNIDDVLKILHKYGAYVFLTDNKRYAEMQDEIANLPPSVQSKTGKWIPVTEKLPKVKQYALITVHNQTKMCWYNNGVFIDGDQIAYTKENEELVAWMPLPEPYKSPESEG